MVLTSYKAEIAIAILNKDLNGFKTVTDQYFSKMTPELESDSTKLYLMEFLVKCCVESKIEDEIAKEMIRYLMPFLTITYDLTTTYYDQYKKYAQFVDNRNICNADLKLCADLVSNEQIPFAFKFDIIISYIEGLTVDVKKIDENKAEIEKYLRILEEGAKDVS